MNEKWKQILKVATGALLYTVFVFAVGFCRGEKHSEAKRQKEIQTAKQTLEDNEAKIDTIRNESDADAIKRFHQDNGPR
ncbi:hypothetical protein [Emticicia sp. BO119]|uniref:hypothetical protein n=1 Tax=Emticicia sp. BO119 TaxID=2757768 RepID=UPI0015F04658|nr:hypothetical protein [Emticicia sp. BO119]MBA4849496.1 hypothetical protein [Emticicia sp. BO119]